MRAKPLLDRAFDLFHRRASGLDRHARGVSIVGMARGKARRRSNGALGN